MKPKMIFTMLLALSLAGLITSVYMTYAHYESAGLCRLAKSSSCDIVNKSEFSEIFSIPVPFIGIAGYLALALASLLKLINAPLFKGLNFPIFVMALTGFGFTLYLKFIEIFVLHAICQLCLVSAVAITFIFVLSILGLNRE